MDDPLSKKKILIVDDLRQNIDVLRDIFSNYVRMVALGGEQAIKIATSKNPPDLILLDVMMPGIDGFEVCKRLKNDPKTIDIPIVFVTAKKEVEDEAFGLSLGAIDYIIKPFNVDVIQKRVRNYLMMKNDHDRLKERIKELTAQIDSLEKTLDSGEPPITFK